LFLAGSGTTIDAAIGSGVRPLNWLLSAGTYYRDGKFRESTDFNLAKELGGVTFLDSGAQQFYKTLTLREFDYPYTDREHLEFALRAGINYIATLDLPLDILHPRDFHIINSYDTSVWVYHAKMDGRVYIWSGRRSAFMRFKVAYPRQYGTVYLMEANLKRMLIMHEDLCTRLAQAPPGPPAEGHF